VHHLGEDHHVVGRLHDLMEVVVEVVRQDRRAGRRAEAQQAPFAERTTFGIVVGARWLESRIFGVLRRVRRGPRRDYPA
jgi:hypothetical protein